MDLRIIPLTLLATFFVSCSQFGNLKNDQVVRLVQEDIEIKDYNIHPGSTKLVYIPVKNSFRDGKLYCDEKLVGMDRVGDHYRAFVSANYYAVGPSFSCFIKKRLDKNTYLSFHVMNFTVIPYEYPFNKLNVPKKHVDLAEKDVQRWLKEKEILKKVYSESIMDRALFSGPFVRPLNSKVTSVYGTKRIFNNKKESWHSGVDFRARRPTPIPVANRGKVVFTGNLFFNGKTVIVDHGLGIFTLYCHLSKIDAKVGTIVEKGNILGLSGNTGRSSAPHLHWGTRVQGNWINGLDLIDQTLVFENQTSTAQK